MKKFAAILLALALMISFAACSRIGKKTVKIDTPEQKIAILVAPESQYPEEYRRAQELAKAYPKTVVVREYADSRILKAGDPAIKTLAEELAADESIGALIFDRATEFTDVAISAAKAVNSELKILCVEPEENLDKLAGLSDLVYCCDWSAAAPAIIAQAKAQGAETFVMLSFNRHLNNNSLVTKERTAFEEACGAEGLTFYYESSLDPTYSGGINQAKTFIGETAGRLKLNDKISNENVAFFSTDSAVQTALIKLCEKNNFVYVCPNFPTPYLGVAELYPDIAAPESVKDVADYITAVKSAAAADETATARLSIFNYPLAATLLDAAVYSAMDLLNGTATAENLTAQAIARLSDASGKAIQGAAFAESQGNVIVGYAGSFESVK